MKKLNIGLWGGIAIAALMLLCIILFSMIQYQFKGAGMTLGKYDGFTVAFGKDNYEGYALFCLPFFLAIIALVVSALAAFKVVKVNNSIMFGVVALCALISFIVYLVTYFHILDKYGRGSVMDLTKNIEWGFSFWCAFVFYIISFVGACYLAIATLATTKKRKR